MTTAQTETLTIEQFIPRPPERVWEAISTPEWLARWWAQGDIRASVGHRFTLDMGKWGQVSCQVLEVETGRRLVYSFADWTLVWTLTETDGGTLLRLEHMGFDLTNPLHRFAFDNMGPGWRSEVLPRLVTVLDATETEKTPEAKKQERV